MDRGELLARLEEIRTAIEGNSPGTGLPLIDKLVRTLEAEEKKHWERSHARQEAARRFLQTQSPEDANAYLELLRSQDGG